jgi:signal transduction histidine kinase
MPPPDPSEEIADLRRTIARLSRLVENSVTLNSTLDLDNLLDFIIVSAADLLNSEAASILLVDDKTHDLYFAASTGSDPEELKRIPVPMDGSIAGTIFRDDCPLIINDVSQDPRHFRDVGDRIHFETRSLIGVPLRIREEVTGVLEAVNKREGVFNESDLQTLSNIAAQAAVAINNARLVDALQHAYDELGKLDKLKSEFISIASHELRTPLGLILGYAALLKEEAGETASTHAEAVLNSALRMRALIETMTNMNMLQVGSATMTLKLQPLKSVVQAAFDEVSTLIDAKGQSVSLELPEEPIRAVVDGPKLTLALVNLLNNAMRFTPVEGQIIFQLERRGREAWLRVSDNGIGIPSDQLERIFDKFYQVGGHMTRRHEGLGLGLAIVRAITEAHGGRVWAESGGVQAGATFTIALPLSD